VICVDASVAAKWVLAEEHSARALALFYDSAAAREPVVIPPLLPLEVTNIIRQRVRRGTLTVDDAEHALEEFLTFPLTLTTSPSPHTEALRLANQHNLPAAYDAYYLALAETAGAVLWTADQRLLRAVGTILPFVRWIGDYSA